MASDTADDMRALRSHLRQGRARAREAQKAALLRLRDEGVLVVAQFTPYHLRVRRTDGSGASWDVWPGTPTFRRPGAARGQHGWVELMLALGIEGVSAP